MFCYPLGLNIKAARNPNIIAEEMPALVNSNIPVNTPTMPSLFDSTNAPFAKEFPNELIGIVAPDPANLINGSYKPSPAKIAPATTRMQVV